MSGMDLCLYALCPVKPWRERSGIGGRDPSAEEGAEARTGSSRFPFPTNSSRLASLRIDVSPVPRGKSRAPEAPEHRRHPLLVCGSQTMRFALTQLAAYVANTVSCLSINHSEVRTAHRHVCFCSVDLSKVSASCYSLFKLCMCSGKACLIRLLRTTCRSAKGGG